MKNIYLKKVIAGIMAVTMMSSFAFPAVYAEETTDVQTAGQSEDDIYDGEPEFETVADEVFKKLDPEGDGGNPRELGGIHSEVKIPLTSGGGYYINDKLQTCCLRRDLAYYEIKTYEGKEIPVDELNAKLEKLEFKNTKIENRDGEYVLLSDSISSCCKAAALIAKCPAVSEINEIWYFIKCGWEMNRVTAEMWYMPKDEILSPDEAAVYCGEFAPVEDSVFYYLNGEEEFPELVVNFSEPFRTGTELTEKQVEFLEKYEQKLDEVKPDGIDEIVKKCRVSAYKSGFPCYGDGKCWLACDEVIEVRSDEGEKSLSFAGDTIRKIEKVNEAPKDEEITGECYYYVEGEDPYVVFKRDGEIKTLKGVVIEPTLYLDVNAGTINYISNDEVFHDFSDGYVYLTSGITDLRTILYKNYFITLGGNKESKRYLVKMGMSPANGGLSHIEKKGNLDGSFCVDITDLSYLSLALLGELELTDEQKEQGDVDNDGKLTLADLAKLRQFLSRKIETLSN